MQIQMSVDWLDEPAIEVTHHQDAIAVVAHAGLSRHQVEAACAELGEHGSAVFTAWQDVMTGEMPGGGVTLSASAR
jgi:hypothetical protein